MNHQETLRQMLDQMIAGKESEASITMHDYFVSKTREVTGLGGSKTTEITETDDDVVDTDAE